MNILALDLGTKTGYAIQIGNQPLISGMKKFPTKMRYLRFQNWLQELEQYKIDAIYYEEVMSHLGVYSAHAYGAFFGHLSAWADSLGIPYKGIPVGTIKKFVTGTGKASKQMVIDAVCDKYKQVKDDNEADAIAILYCGLNELKGG